MSDGYKISSAERERLRRVEEAKNLEKELKTKRKKKFFIIFVSIFSALVILGLGFLISYNVLKNVEGTYYSSSQTLILRENNTFTANLADSRIKSGTYSVSGDTITFNVAGSTSTGEVSFRKIKIPSDWDDGHNHSLEFKKK